jgi:prepilin-type N-terminal cleavage/methylation domain-containing protein
MVTLNTHREPHVSSAPRRVRARGFTLIEILTVIVILGIASAVIAPQIGSRDDIKAKAGARVVIADLLYAQNMAIAKQAYYYVRFNAANETYQVMTGPGASSTDQANVIDHPVSKGKFTTTFGPAGDGRVRDIKIKSAVFNGVTSSFTDEFTLAFDELGTPYVYCYDVGNRNELLDGNIVIECGAYTITVSVERYTGEIKVQ